MRRLFNVMSIVVLACVYFVVSSSGSAQAQTATPTPTPGILTSDYTPAFLTPLNRDPLPGFGVLVADLNVHVTASVQFNTLTLLGQYCRDSFLYRVTGMGDLIAHPFTCQGDIMAFNGTGGANTDTSDYYVALFPSAKAAQGAPQSIIRSLDTEALPNQYQP